MNETENKYEKILRFFNTYLEIDNLLECNSKTRVTIDDIHDAIIYEGISLEQPISFYIHRAKIIHWKDYGKNNKRSNILKKEIKNLENIPEFAINNIINYNLNEIENQLVLEILKGIPAYKSKISRRKRVKILDSIRSKVLTGNFLD